MQKSKKLLESIGKLIVATRTTSMDQTELGQRIGVGRNTISAIENGKAVNAETLFNVLEHLQLIEEIQFVIDEKLDDQISSLARKSRKKQQALDNDF